ncbi:ATP-binding protein [Protofrankia sp. BMG5.30]|uniref:ATP-binding protein n=1 Tax=Protofrankia sp. BMG5.30 TaxID=1834514 RepID=UPI00097704AD|nr:ATP-binding protein [Protofrankia sp. BMG5.30]ONH35820.1 ATPase [Protofrankia sp. BMG5.30]
MSAGVRMLRLVPLDPTAFHDRYVLAETDEPELTLGELLADLPAFSLTPLDPAYLDVPVRRLVLELAEPDPSTPLHLPPGLDLTALAAAGSPRDGGPAAGTDAADNSAANPAAGAGSGPGSGIGSGIGADVDTHVSSTGRNTPLPGQGGDTAGRDADAAGPAAAAESGYPETLSEREAVLIAHDTEINRAAAYLESGLSVLVRCEKLLVEHLAHEIAGRSGRPQRTPRPAGGAATAVPGTPSGPGEATPLGGGRRAELLAALQAAVADAKPGDVVVVPHLDLLAGGSDAALTSEARELADVLYERSACVLLAFTDPSLVIPEVLANRFAVRLSIEILPREVTTGSGARVPVGRALVTREEAGLFDGFDAADLYKYVAGMNAVRLRNALRFAYHQHRPALREGDRRPTFADLRHELRVFKARTSSSFEVPNVPFSAIGGYAEVKAELARALTIIGGAVDLPAHLRHDLVPRGFIFHGPPGTGKTLFAKAVAARLAATILVVSGPEVTDMYVGESERKIRDLFAEARRNAPAVVVFDEFDSIAASRTGRGDGGSRAGNAIVAQLLTELDGFRPEVPVLIIGTTNRIDLIDDALLRPSRFRPIRIGLPDEDARREIVRVHAEHFGIPVGPALVDAIARATEGFNGDEIRSVFRDGRADELVGDPRRPADARRLGELIGALRAARQQRELAKSPPSDRRTEDAIRRDITDTLPIVTDGEEFTTDTDGNSRAGTSRATGTRPGRGESTAP